MRDRSDFNEALTKSHRLHQESGEERLAPITYYQAALFRLMSKGLEETVMFANEDKGFQELFDRLLAYNSTKQSVKMSEINRRNRRDDPMGVDAR